MARGERKDPKMAEYKEQLRRAEALLGDEKKPEPSAPAESPEEVLRRAEETLARGDMPPETTETDEEVRARVRREMLEHTADRKETAKPAPAEEKSGKLSPDRRSELASKISAYEAMIAQEEAQIEHVTQEMQLSEGARRQLGKHLPQMRETLRKIKEELRRDDERKEGLTP